MRVMAADHLLPIHMATQYSLKVAVDQYVAGQMIEGGMVLHLGLILV